MPSTFAFRRETLSNTDRTVWKQSAHLLFDPRPSPSFGRLEAAVILLYSAVLAITIPFHEQWSDEAQAWLIARDSSLWDIFYKRLHYEGTPGLWHFVLWIATRLHLPYGAINWLSASVAIAGIYVFLRYSPFPPLIRYLLPFTFWLQYQYAVTARSYSLAPLFVFSLCALFCLPRPRPLLFAITAGLMANLSLYSSIWAVIFAGFFLRAKRSELKGRSLLPAGVVLSSLLLLAFYTALPAPDLVFRNDGANFLIHQSRWRNKLIPPTPMPAGWVSTDEPDSVTPHSKSEISPPESDPTLYTRGNRFQRAVIRLLFPTDQTYRVQTIGHRLRRLLIPVNATFFCISRSNLVGIAFILVWAVWLITRATFWFALPLPLMLIFGTITWINDHHTGLLFLAIICAAWLSWVKPVPANPHNVRMTIALSLLLLTVIVEQIGWSTHAVISDIRGPFDPGHATADFLNHRDAHKRVMGLAYGTVSSVPFLPPHTFANQPSSYWIYSSNVPYGKQIPRDFASKPDIFVVGAEYLSEDSLANQIVPMFPANKSFFAIEPHRMRANGYVEFTRFCGHIFMRASASVTYCNIIYVPRT